MDSVVDFYTMSSRTIGISKKRTEDGDGRSNTTECDSTTEPASQKMQLVVGDDVFYQEDSGQNVLGTVALIQGKKIKLIFLDETEKWTHVSKIKKWSFPDEGADDNKSNTAPSSEMAVQQPTVEGGVSGAFKKKSKSDMNGHNTPKENLQVTCGSCGTQKTIASKKAVEFTPYTQHQYNCRKCINKSKTSKNNGVHIPISTHILAASRSRPKGSDNVTMSKNLLDDNPFGNFQQENEICLHCRCQITEKVSLHCTMCDRPCHSSCLALTPPPLAGDIFWSIICHVCGTQKRDGSPENDSQKLYSSRRSITSWSDIAYLLLMCLGCKYPNQKFFDLDQQIIPFWEENASRLHLPRQYKAKDPSERRFLLEGALKNANLRFYTDEESKTNTLWAIKEPSKMNLLIKPPHLIGNRGVTAAGFPISVRTSNPEVASAAMTNIAQTIAVNKVVPSPKNSPSLVTSKPTMVKTNSSIPNQPPSGLGSTTTVKKPQKPEPNSNVAKKTGYGGASARGYWNQQSRVSKCSFVTETPKSSPNGLVSREEGTQPLLKTPAKTSTGTTVSPQPSHKHVLSPSPGGAARVTGMIISSTISPPSVPLTSSDVTSRSTSASYPVRKNGSPMLNRSIRVEPVEAKRTDEMPPQRQGFNYHADAFRRSDHDLIRESPGFNNNSLQQKAVIKRKFSPAKVGDSSYTRVLDREAIDSEAKKIKMSLPTSTDITSQRVPSPTKPSEILESPKCISDTKSPLQKLSDLEKKGLSISRLVPSESGSQVVQSNGEISTNVSRLSAEKHDSLPSTPIKINGATVKISNVDMLDGDEQTKDKTNNVTTSPRAFKLASVTSPGTKPPQSLADRKLARPQRLKRSVVTNAQAVKQSKESDKKVTGKGSSATAAAAAAIVSKVNRGRPKKPYGHKFSTRKPSGGMAYSIGQFNGPVQTEAGENSSNIMLESDYSWNKNTINDLLMHGGGGYRIGCLPKSSDSKDDLTTDALKHLKDEVAPRPPSYWSSGSSRSQFPGFRKSKRDLKNIDSYYINGSRTSEQGLQYHVIWRDGNDFEYSTDEELETGIDLKTGYLTFDSTTIDYILDTMSVECVEKSDCDKGPGKLRDNCTENKGLGSELHRNLNTGELPKVKREPSESQGETTPRKIIHRQETAFIHMTPSSRNVVVVDLTDESP